MSATGSSPSRRRSGTNAGPAAAAVAAADVLARFASALAGISRRRRCLVGVSGGIDSVVLLDLLLAAGFRDLIVCHLDHRLRGRASAGDARFVRALARRLGLACESGAAEVARQAAARSRSLETAAREARLEFFAAAALKHRCRTLFLGHHADDRVETFLFNLCRGAGPAGLRAMRATSRHGRLTVVRPLLGVWRPEIAAYAAARNLLFRHDATNDTLGPARNRLRHVVLPLLAREFGRDVRMAVWRAAEILAAEDDYLATLTPAPRSAVAVRDLRLLPAALQRRALRAWLQARGTPEVGFALVEAIRALLAPGAAAASVNLPGGRRVRRRAGQLFVAP